MKMGNSIGTSRGGKRKGAGRPPSLDTAKRVNVYLSANEIAVLKKLGKGSLTAGIRKAIELLETPS